MEIGMECRVSADHGGMESAVMIEGVWSATHSKVESGSALLTVSVVGTCFLATGCFRMRFLG